MESTLKLLDQDLKAKVAELETKDTAHKTITAEKGEIEAFNNRSVKESNA